MKRKRFSVEQIVAILKHAEVGVPVVEVCPQTGITEHWLSQRPFWFPGACAEFC